MEKKLHEVALDTLGSGAAVELFGAELAKALANIADVNTAAEAKREITLTVTIKPSKDRSFGTVAISCRSRLAFIKPYESAFHMGIHEGSVRAFEEDLTQPALPGIESRKIIPIGGNA